MHAKELRDPSFEIKLSLEQVDGNRTTTFIIDGEGRWCDIPCADNSLTLRNLIERYYKPMAVKEMQRLANLQMFMREASLSGKQIMLGSGLFYYEPPDTGMFEEANWKGALAQAMVQAGLPVRPTPPQLFRSINPAKDGFFDYEVNPHSYRSLTRLMTTTWVLCPALSQFDPDLLSGDSLATGYKAAIGIDGNALLGLLSEDDIQRDEDHPQYDRVYVATIHSALKKLLE